MGLSEKVAERVVYYFKDFYNVGGNNISVNPKDAKRVDYRNFSFVIDIDDKNNTLDVVLIPSGVDEADFERYLSRFDKHGFYKENRRKIHRHRKRIQGGRFEVDGSRYHYRARLSPLVNNARYLDQLTAGVIDCVIRPAMLFERNRNKK